MARRVPYGGTYNIGFRAYIDAGEPTPIERLLFYTGATYKIGLDSTTKVERSLHVLDGAVAVFGGGFEPPSETFCSGTDTYGPPLLLVNKMSDVVDTKPLAQRSTDLAWRPAAGPWEDVEREQEGARPARGSAGPAQQLPARDQVRPSSQVLPRDEDRGRRGVPHFNVVIIGDVNHGKTTLIRALLQRLADQRPDNFVTNLIDTAPPEREGDFFAAAPVFQYVFGMGVPRIEAFTNKCDTVDTPELQLRGRVEPGSAPAWSEIGRYPVPGAAMLYAVGTGLPRLGRITVDAPCGLQAGAAEFWTGYTHPGPVEASVPAVPRAEPKSSSSVTCEVLIQPIERRETYASASAFRHPTKFPPNLGAATVRSRTPFSLMLFRRGSMKKVRLAARLGFVLFLAVLPDPTKASEIDCLESADSEFLEVRRECAAANPIFFPGVNAGPQRWNFGHTDCVDGDGDCPN